MAPSNIINYSNCSNEQ